MNWAESYAAGLPYTGYLERYGTPQHQQRWQAVYDQIHLTEPQRLVLAGFPRQMHLLCVAGTWCGDCVREGPILQHLAAGSPQVSLRFIDRDDHADVAAQLTVNGGLRIPMLVFLSEDDMECARYGERTLATYRKMAAEQLGPACPTGIVSPGENYLAIVTQEWLNEIERVQLLLRLSPRLRAKHGD
ncbi:MAG: thiol reductase thioredoxin [Armatimonadetes bacterium 13_1_40CM_64_14]|nr:MAG: thiol reductase thioredoxin [Armatimonadetes bacterium 13_1_40CM_64_14]